MRAVYAVDAELCNVLHYACHKLVRGAHGRDSSGLRVRCCSLQPQCAAHGADADLRICSNSSALSDARVAYTRVVCCAMDRLRWFVQVRYFRSIVLLAQKFASVLVKLTKPVEFDRQYTAVVQVGYTQSR